VRRSFACQHLPIQVRELTSALRKEWYDSDNDVAAGGGVGVLRRAGVDGRLTKLITTEPQIYGQMMFS